MTQPADGMWPPVLDFVSMLQNPGVGFHDSELKTSAIEKDANKQPRPRSGNFAVCYKATLASTKNVCIRLFSRKADERRERYAQISAHLNANPIDCLVKFEYVEKGIRHPNPAKVGNKAWFPIVRMDWVEGRILFDWLRDRCQANDGAEIARAADNWIVLAEQLASVGIAHGDLQHANVMVTAQGQLRLVDYDCMCVPGLVGRPNLELGVEPYQHPERNEETKLFPGLDHFSELFILVVLRALAADPQLWFRYIEPPEGEPYDKLLIRKSDFDSPQTSPIFKEFRQSRDHEVARLAAELLRQYKLPLAQVPPLATFVFDFDEVRKLFRQRHWDEGLERLSRCQPANQPADLVAESAKAGESIAARIELERLLQTPNEQQIQAAYNPKLLDDYPAAQPSVQAAKLSVKVQSALNLLEDAKKSHNWRLFVSTWDANSTLLTRRASANAYLIELDLWRERNALCDKVRRLQAMRPINPAALRQACSLLAEKGGHPEIDAELPGIELLEKRSSALELFQNVPDPLGEANDLALMSAWREDLFAGWADAERQRPRLNDAAARLGRVNQIRQVAKAANDSQSIQGEKSLWKLARELPKQYEFKSTLKSRIAQAKACLQALEPVEKTLAQNSPSEKVLAKAWGQLSDLNATAIVPEAMRERLQLATQRIPLLEKLAAINLEGPMDVVDNAVKSVWKNGLLKDCPDALPWKQRASDALARAALIVELDQAAATTDDFKVVDIADNPLLRHCPMGSTMTNRIETARKKLTKIQVMIDALKGRRDEDFARLFDRRIVKANCSAFAPYQAQITDILSHKVLPVDCLGLSKPTVGRSIDAEKNLLNRYHVKWTWPSQRFTDHCVIGICRGTPPGQSDPVNVAIHRIPIDRQRWEQAGGVYSLTAKADWRTKGADVVAVWAILDLGFQTFYSEPLIIGRIAYQEAMSNRD